MKYLLFLLFPISLLANSEENESCEFHREAEVSFFSNTSKDKIKVIVSGKTCQMSKLELVLMNETGDILHSHSESFERWYWPESLREKVLTHANKLLTELIENSSNLKTKFECEIDLSNCTPYERNVVPLDRYLALKKASIPMISHSKYYEGWASWVYDPELRKAIKVYEAGL